MSAVYDLKDTDETLSSLVARAAEVGDVVIAHEGRQVAVLVPLAPVQANRRIPGQNRLGVTMEDDFDAPLPDDIMRAFNGEGD